MQSTLAPVLFIAPGPGLTLDGPGNTCHVGGEYKRKNASTKVNEMQETCIDLESATGVRKVTSVLGFGPNW